MPIENKYEVDDELEEIDDEFDLLAKEYSEEYAIEVLTNHSKRIFDKVNKYVIPFNNSFDNPNSLEHNKVDPMVVYYYLKFLRQLYRNADTNMPIKELEIVIKTLENLSKSISFESLFISLNNLGDNTYLQPMISSYQVASNIYTNMFLDIFNSSVKVYLNENKIPLE